MPVLAVVTGISSGGGDGQVDRAGILARGELWDGEHRMLDGRTVAVAMQYEDFEIVGEAGQHVHRHVHGDDAGLGQGRAGAGAAEEGEVVGGIEDDLAAAVGIERRAQRAAAVEVSNVGFHETASSAALSMTCRRNQTGSPAVTASSMLWLLLGVVALRVAIHCDCRCAQSSPGRHRRDRRRRRSVRRCPRRGSFPCGGLTSAARCRCAGWC